MTTDELNYHKDIMQKELGMIQDVVKRMAANSFQIKAWAIALFSAIVAFSLDKLAKQDAPILGMLTSLLLLVPVICFWYLDAFFLKTERLYRNLYKWVVEHRVNNPETLLYDLNTFERKTKKIEADAEGGEQQVVLHITNSHVSEEKGGKSILRIMFSQTLIWFYLSPLLFIVVLFGYNYNNYSYLKSIRPKSCQSINKAQPSEQQNQTTIQQDSTVTIQQ